MSHTFRPDSELTFWFQVEIRADMMIPYPHTKAWGQVPCEDVSMRIPLPECWIYQFRTEKHHVSLSQLAAGSLNLSTRMGSVKSAHRRAGKVKNYINQSGMSFAKVKTKGRGICYLLCLAFFLSFFLSLVVYFGYREKQRTSAWKS